MLLGNGDGTFQPVMTFNSGGYLSGWVAIGDVNGDGFPDVLVASPCNASCDFFEGTLASVGVLLNNSAPRKSSTTTTVASSLNPSFGRSGCYVHGHSEFECWRSAEWRDDHIQERVCCSGDSAAQRWDGLAHDLFVGGGHLHHHG